ncbi:MAG: pantetheine-phosphate adenylyltransferase [Spirochaetales bacterium]|nr:pantetheine-phosphate adenylyltransferase [Spirochaetales bacterium]MBR2317204.1 pantetheine-phosphate adenylyltransferase [Spirochaetales bacterium]
MTNTKVVYPGTFDPLTYGHLDIIQRAANMFGNVTVLLAQNLSKNTYFTLEERTQMIKEAIAEMHLEDKVKIASYQGLLVEYCKENNITVIIRGIRPLVDFEYEFEMAMTNRELSNNIETVFILTDQKYFYLRSSLIKDLATLGGDISNKVPPNVYQAIKNKFC